MQYILVPLIWVLQIVEKCHIFLILRDTTSEKNVVFFFQTEIPYGKNYVGSKNVQNAQYY